MQSVASNREDAEAAFFTHGRLSANFTTPLTGLLIVFARPTLCYIILTM